MSAILAVSPETPKSYLPEDERQALLREGGMNLVYLAESQEAGRAGDETTAWAWLRFAQLPAYVLMSMKKSFGAQFVVNKGLDTTPADQVYGPDWLRRA